MSSTTMSMPPPLLPRTSLTSRPVSDATACLLQCGLEVGEDLAVAPPHMTEMLRADRGVSRREEPLYVGPNEHRGYSLVARPELGQEQGLPELLIGIVTGNTDQPVLHSDLLQPTPVIDAGAIQNRKRQPASWRLQTVGEKRRNSEVTANGIEPSHRHRIRYRSAAIRRPSPAQVP